MLANDIMDATVISINALEEVYELSKLLMKNKLESIPVCDNSGKIVGIVGTTEIVDFKPGLLVQDIMVRNFISVNTSTTMEEIASIFIMFEKLRQIPVFEDQRLVGVISRQAVLKVLNSRISLNK